jgi:hypothetical protein
MKYISVWTIRPENMKAARERFLKGDVQIPGFKLVTRWHSTGDGWGVNLIETDDPVALAKYGNYWNDLIDIKTAPAVDDAQAAAALK